MSRSPLLLLALPLLAIPLLPVDGVGQVNLPAFRNLVTGELVERPYAERYQRALLDRRRSEYFRRSERLADYGERQAAYASDACGLGCELHEGLQVRGIPGTFLSVALYKARLDDGVLTLQLRFHNDGSEPGHLAIDPVEAPESFYVQVGEVKLRILQEEDGDRASKGTLDELLEPGGIESWWARFPAPPHGTTTFDLHIPGVAFRDVPLEDD